MIDALLELDAITFGYRRTAPPLLENVGLRLEERGVTAILGPNGAGKTTLLYLALGWLRPWVGTIRLGGRPLGRLTRSEVGRWMALVPQSEHVPFEYSVLEYVLLGRAPHLPTLAMPGERDVAVALAALESCGIAHLRRRSILGLSGGERELMLLARALTQQPRLLLLDEPTAHLDLRNKARVIGIVRDLQARGIAALLTTHEPEVAMAVADRAVLMGEGGVLAAGPTEDALTAENLSRVYGIPIRVTAVEGTRQVTWT